MIADVNKLKRHLLIIEKTKSLFPITEIALNVAQTSRIQLKEYLGAIVVFSDGSAKRIRNIEVAGFYGETILRKIISALTSAYRIRTVFEDYEVPFTQFKGTLIMLLKKDQESCSPNLPQNENINICLDKIQKAGSIKELFSILTFPPPEDCLDVL